MSVRATTRREQIRRPNGDREVLPGGQDATGLSALAAVSAGVDTITGAARHATQADVIEPAAEAVVLFENLEGTSAYLSNTTLPAGVTRTYGWINQDLGDRNDNAGWSVTRADSGDRCDDPQSQAGLPPYASQVDLDACNAPMIYTFATALDRALVNAQADPALTPWALSSAPVRVNLFPTPTHTTAGVPAIWAALFNATVSDVASAGFAGTRYLRLTAVGSGAFNITSREFGVISPGQTVTMQARIKGTAPQGRMRVETYYGGTWSSTITLTASWQLVTATYTHPTTAPTARLFLVPQGLGAVAGNTLDFDAMFVEEGAVADPYADPIYGTGNLATNGSVEVNLTNWSNYFAPTGTRDNGWSSAGQWSRKTVTTATTAQGVIYLEPGTVVPGEVITVGVDLMCTDSASFNVRGRLGAVGTPSTAEPVGTVATINLVANVPQRLVFQFTVPAYTGTQTSFTSFGWEVFTTGLIGRTFYADAVTLHRGVTTGRFVDAAAWDRAAAASRTLLTRAPAAVPAYSRPVDATAPQLTLTGSKWVHRRTGALAAGERISTPWKQFAYNLLEGRTFSVAGWLSVTPTTGPLPSFRWVLELAIDPGTITGQTVITATSAPFSPADVYARYAALLSPLIPFGVQGGVALRYLRVHLECVDPGTIGAGATVSIRGGHMYAGGDRGDRAGLDAVLLPEWISWAVDFADPLDPSFKATRIDVHGNDQISHITAASASLVDASLQGREFAGSSAGRLTLRVPNPDPLAVLNFVNIYAEEISGGPGAQASLQTIQVWHEVNATPDIVSLVVDRASDADPGSSTVPIGNYAATTIDLELDDAEGTWSLFGRRYIDLGHRLEAAVGLTYTNRCDDPLGIDTAAAAAPSLTWPSSAAGMSPVVPVSADQFGQVPPAPFVGHSAATVAPMAVTSPALEGWSQRGSAWVRYTGATVPTVSVQAVRRYAVPGAGVTVVPVGAATPLTFTAAPNVWTLVKIPATTIALGANALALFVGVGVADASRFIEIAAPDFERLDLTSGDVIEVVETAPAGVFSSTSWDAATGGASVQVSGIDVLATAGSGDLGNDLHVNTTVEAELRFIAREYLDLGADQVVIVDQATPLPYAIPTQKVSTQIADLAKVAALTAFTDGAGRFTALLRSEVEPDVVTHYLSDRNLLEASAAIAPDIVKNDVKVTAHPVARTADAVLATVGNSSATDTAAAGWTLSGQEIYLPPGYNSVVIEVGWQADAALDGVVLNAVGWFDWQVGQAAPFNVFYVEPDGTTAIAMPPGANWGLTLSGGASWASATVEVFPTFGRITLTNRQSDPGPGPYVPSPYAPAVYVDHLEIVGDGLTVTSVSQRFVRSESVDAFGSQPVDVDVRLAQSTALLPVVGVDVLDNYSLRDATGERWLPDLEATVLADPWLELGDRVLIGDPDSSIAGEYRVLTHKLSVDVGAESAIYLRRVPVGVDFAVTDVSLADDGKVTSY